VSVTPLNSPELVKKVATRLKIDLNAKILLYATDNSETPNLPVNTPLSVSNIFSNLLDLHMQPKRDTVATLASYAVAVSEKKTGKFECRYW